MTNSANNNSYLIGSLIIATSLVSNLQFGNETGYSESPISPSEIPVRNNVADKSVFDTLPNTHIEQNYEETDVLIKFISNLSENSIPLEKGISDAVSRNLESLFLKI